MAEPLDIVRRFYELARRDDWSRLELLSEDVVYRPVAEIIDAGEYHGRDGFRRYMEGFFDSGWSERMRIETPTLRAYGDSVIARLQFAGRGQASGADFSARVFIVYTVRDGQIVRVEDFTDRTEALRAAGVAEEGGERPPTRVELVRRLFDAWNRGDLDTMGRHLARDVEWSPVGPTDLEGEVYRGAAEVKAAFDAVWETWSEFSFEEREVRDLGDAVLWLGRAHMRGTAGAVPLDQEFAVHFVVRDGKVLRANAYASWSEARAAAVPPPPPAGPHAAALQRIYRGWAEGDLFAEPALYDSHLVYIAKESPDPGPHYGLDALTEYGRRFLTSWDDWRIEALEYREAGDSVLVRIRRTALGKASRLPVEDEAFQVWTFRGGKVIRLEVYQEEADALAALGMGA